MSAIQSPAEQAMYQADRTFHALRAVGFLFTQLQTDPPSSEWEGERLEDLGILIEFLADHGAKITDEGMDSFMKPDVA